MRILITTGLSLTDIGGPFQYAPRLKEEFEALGHKVRIVSYGVIERMLPIGFRHAYFFLKILPSATWADKVLTLDTYSVGIPSVLMAKILGRKIIVRVGGDFLWSAYVNRTLAPISLSDFYTRTPRLNSKERLILFFTMIFVKLVNYLAFNTQWQKDIWITFYKIPESKTGVVRNFIPEKQVGNPPKTKDFMWSGRLIPEKNIPMLKKFSVDVVIGKSHEEVLKKLKDSYVAVSLAFTDICPNFIIEAISFNKPFITTRATGLNEIFPNGGIFVDSSDEREIKRAMEDMLDENTYNTHVAKLKESNLTHSWQEMAQEFVNLWKKL